MQPLGAQNEPTSRDQKRHPGIRNFTWRSSNAVEDKPTQEAMRVAFFLRKKRNELGRDLQTHLKCEIT